MRVSLITPSYVRDAALCRALCASVDRHAPASIEHVLVIPRGDLSHFDGLQGPRRRIVFVEDVLPRYFLRAPYFKKLWLTPYSLPVRGWILQQIVKLSTNLVSEADAFVFMDSDIVFVRPVDTALFVRDGRVRMFRKPGTRTPSRKHGFWKQTAERLLDIPHTNEFGADYIGPLVSWRRDTLGALQRRIASVAKTDWQIAIARQVHFSEYMTYGVFAEQIGAGETDHMFSPVDLCHLSWDYDLDSQDECDRFVRGLAPHHIAVLIQTNQHVAEDRRHSLLESIRKTIGKSGGATPAPLAFAQLDH